jgi:hypothetical protein
MSGKSVGSADNSGIVGIGGTSKGASGKVGMLKDGGVGIADGVSINSCRELRTEA